MLDITLVPVALLGVLQSIFYQHRESDTMGRLDDGDELPSSLLCHTLLVDSDGITLNGAMHLNEQVVPKLVP